MKHHHLESQLKNAIAQQNEKQACELIDCIQDSFGFYPGPNLRALDEYGRSFLALALFHDLTPVYEKLFALQKNDPTILFAKDKHGCSLIFYAAEIGCIPIVEHLIRTSEKIKNGNGYKIWLAESNERKTLLHCPYFHVNTFFYILKKIVAEKDFLNFINKQTAFEQNTPLHDICLYSPSNTNRTEAFARAISLIRLGADMTIKNKEGFEPLIIDLTRRQEISRELENFIKFLATNGYFIGRAIPLYIYSVVLNLQYAFFATKYFSAAGIQEVEVDINIAINEVLLTDRNTQEAIIENCYSTLQRDPSSTQLKDFYHRLKNLCSLKELIIETCERNNNFPLPKQKVNPPDELVVCMPRYTERLKAKHLFFRIGEADNESINPQSVRAKRL